MALVSSKELRAELGREDPSDGESAFVPVASSYADPLAAARCGVPKL
jgi:hypothetical protein